MGTAESKKKWHNVAKDTMYNFAPHLDLDMITTGKNLADTQTKLNHKWVIEDLQTDQQVNLESDPICSSAGCDQYRHKHGALGYDINYPVPNFGEDQDILDARNNLKLVEGLQGHKIIMGTAESRKKWHNVAKDTMYNFAPRYDEDIVASQKNL